MEVGANVEIICTDVTTKVTTLDEIFNWETVTITVTITIHHKVKWGFANYPLRLMNVDSQYQIITA